MFIKKETSLFEFDFWGGAIFNASVFTDSELETIERYLEDLYPDGIDETLLNDIFWFEPETLASWVFGWEGDENELETRWNTFYCSRT